MSNIMIAPNLAEEIVEDFGPKALEDYHAILDSSVEAIKGFEDDVVKFFSVHPHAPVSFYAPIYNTSSKVN